MPGDTTPKAGNELILKNLKRLLQTDKSVWVRIPVIPTVNDTEEEMRGIKRLLTAQKSPEKVELLSYHAMSEHKYAALGKEVHAFSVPGEEKMKQLKSYLFTS